MPIGSGRKSIGGWKVNNRISPKCLEGCTCKRHVCRPAPEVCFKQGTAQPWQSELMRKRWADPEWSEQRRELLKKKEGQKKRGAKSGSQTRPKGIPAWNKKEPVVRECLAEGCSTVISTPPSLARIRFCGHSCQARTTNRRNPEDMPSEGYGEGWPVFREGIKDRDGHQCRVCGGQGKRLEVHHLCYDTGCRDEAHLVTLCSGCHQGGHRRQAWPIELKSKLIPVTK